MISIIVPCKTSELNIGPTITALCSFFQFRFPGAFEILAVLNPVRQGDTLQSLIASNPALEQLNHLSRSRRELKVVLHYGRAGKFAALKTGFQHARGDMILFTDADLPYGLHFFDEAVAQLKNGADLVTGDRRHPKSTIQAPFRLLHRAVARDRIGRIFNGTIRLFFPSILAQDTQAGIKAMSREFAAHAFELQIDSGFYGDLEIALVAQAHSYKHIQLPVAFHYGENPSSISFYREIFVAFRSCVKIWFRQRLGAYDSGLSPSALESNTEDRLNNRDKI